MSSLTEDDAKTSYTTRKADCLGCRLVGGGTLAAIALFLRSQISHQRSRPGRAALAAASLTAAALSAAKFFDLTTKEFSSVSPVRKT